MSTTLKQPIDPNEFVPKKYSLYILLKENDKYLISACEFTCTVNIDTYIFQMLKDTYFSMINHPKDGCEFEIVSCVNLGTNEQSKISILKYFNNNLPNINIKSLLKFKCNHVGDYISSNILSLTSDTKIKNIKLEFFVNKYDTKLYISNPYFSISKNDLNNLIKY